MKKVDLLDDFIKQVIGLIEKLPVNTEWPIPYKKNSKDYDLKTRCLVKKIHQKSAYSHRLLRDLFDVLQNQGLVRIKKVSVNKSGSNGAEMFIKTVSFNRKKKSISLSKVRLLLEENNRDYLSTADQKAEKNGLVEGFNRDIAQAKQFLRDLSL